MTEQASRLHTAFVMAQVDVYRLRGFLEDRVLALRREADEIETFLKTATKQTDEWARTLKEEARRAVGEEARAKEGK